MGSTSLKSSKLLVVPHFKRLHELIANEKGYFRQVGLDIEFREDVLDETHNAPDFPRISGEDLATGDKPSMNAACSWGVCVSAGAGKGKLVRDAHFKTENSIFVRPESKIRKPQDLAGVEVAVGELSGSHFSGIQSLEEFLPKESVRVKLAGGPATRLRKMVSGELEVANLLPPCIYIARQLGFREVIARHYKTLLWAGNITSPFDVKKYVKALSLAQKELQRSPDSYKHYWEELMPKEFIGKVDLKKFGAGEVLVEEPYTESDYETTLAWMKSWGLTERMREENYQKIIVSES